jgi:hypothetical protein
VSIPDARRSGPGIGWRERRAGPRHAAVWIRIRGQWRKGRISEWITDPGQTGWDCLIMADEPFSGVPWQGRYIYEPATIRPRDEDTPPGELPPYIRTPCRTDRSRGRCPPGPRFTCTSTA